jgi:hypothetical protein
MQTNIHSECSTGWKFTEFSDFPAMMPQAVSAQASCISQRE